MKAIPETPFAFKIQSLLFQYKQKNSVDLGWALRLSDCLIEAGTIVGVIGPNGSGKTSFLKLLMGILQPDFGTIFLFGQDLRVLKPAEIAQQVALVPHETSQAFPFTLGELVLMGRFPFYQSFDGLGWDSQTDVQLATQAMQDMEIGRLANRLMVEVSGGERQRAMIARALTQNPQVLLLDEPTAFLDLHHQVDIVQKLRCLNQERGLTVIMVSHDLNLASQCCDQMILFDQGEIVKRGSPPEVLCPEVLEPVYRCQVIVDRHPYSEMPRVTLPV